MVGTIAQIIAIVSYGNENLCGNNDFILTYENSTLKFCNKVCFIDWVKPNWIDKTFKGKKEHYGVDIASEFKEWIDFLRSEGILRLYLHYTGSSNSNISNRMTSGFVGGGGRWLIEAYNGKTSDFWEAKWEVNDRDNKERRIWKVTYARIAKNSESRIEHHSSINGIKTELLKSITDCRDFAKQHELNGFHNCFESAINCLEESDFSKVYHQDNIPVVRNKEECKSILFSCQLAWVFGGMGSWNDLGFRGQEQCRYEQISDRLYNVICHAIPCATNVLHS